jgi:hypothetical protein
MKSKDKKQLLERICKVETPYKTLGQLMEEKLVPFELVNHQFNPDTLYSVVRCDNFTIWRDIVDNKLYAIDMDGDIEEVECVYHIDYDDKFRPRVNNKIIPDEALDCYYPNDYCGEFDDCSGYGYFCTKPVRRKIVHLCKGCQEEYLQTHGEGMGYITPFVVRTVSKTKCDNWELPDGRLLMETKEAEYEED